MNTVSRTRIARAGGASLLALLALAGGCAVKDRPADGPLPARGRMSYDAETTLKLAVADRLAEERRAMASMIAAARPLPATRPASITLPAPQLIPAPEKLAAKGFTQGGSASPLAESLAAVTGANEAATRSPTPAGYLNAIHYYDYSPGVRYNAVAAAGYLTAIELRPGERLLSLSCSDSANYHVERVQQGSGGAAQTLLLVKPKAAGGQSNWVITTDERTYFVDVLVNEKADYQSAIAWNYPVDDVRLLAERGDELRVRIEKGGADGGAGGNAFTPAGPAARLGAAAGGNGDTAGETPPGDAGALGPTVGPLGMNLGELNFEYLVLYQPRGRDGKRADAPAPPWAPLRVFDDGRKTYLQLPEQARRYELPPLYALDHPGDPEPKLVNYRRSGDYLVADRLAPAWELRAGEAPQQIVQVVRGKPNDPGQQPVVLDGTGVGAVEQQ